MKKKLITALLAMTVGLLVCGCAFFSSKPPRNPPTPLVNITNTKEAKVVWSKSVGSSEHYIFEPAFTNDAVFAASADGDVTKVNLSTGETIWSTSANKKLTAGVGTDGNIVVVAGQKGRLIALDAATGQPRWKSRLSTEALTSPIVSQGFVVVRTMDNRITGFDAKNGEKRWEVPYRAPPLMLRSTPGMIAVGPTVVVSMPGGKMLSLMINTGAIRWEIPVGEARGTTELERIADLSGTPALFGQGVCVSSYHGRLGCFNVVSGQPYWMHKFSSKVSVAIDEEHVYAIDADDRIFAYANVVGKEKWKSEKLMYRHLSAPISYRKYIAVGDLEGYVHFLSRYDGSMEARVSIDSSPISAALQRAGNKVIVLTRKGTLAAIVLD